MVGVNLREDARHGIHEIHLQNPAKASVFIRLQLVNLLPLFSWLSCFSPYGAAAKGQILAGKTRAGGRKIPKIRYGKIICPRTGVLRQGTETGKC